VVGRGDTGVGGCAGQLRAARGKNVKFLARSEMVLKVDSCASVAFYGMIILL